MEKPWRLWPQSLALAAALGLGMTVVAQDGDDAEFHDEAEAKTEAAEAKEENLEQRREELLTMAEETIDDLSDRNEAAARLLDRAHGWAVLDTTKGGFIVTGAGGTGVAKEKGSNEEVFMHVGGAGIGAVGGVANYKLVLLFDDETTFEEFVDGEWQAGAAAQAIAGDEAGAVSEDEGFIDGAAVYRVDEGGLIAQAELQGMRFWPSDRLNELP
jgi:lipid-binding SYLF domain-containing protein